MTGERDASFVRLLEQVAAAEAAAPSISEALRACMRAVCAWTGWPVGMIHLPAGGDTDAHMSPGDAWIGYPPDRYAAFRAATEALRLAPGAGLPGRVMADGAAAWVPDVTVDGRLPRAGAARAAGLRGAFAFPVAGDDELFAVLEFFSTAAAEPDERLLEAGAHLGRQLGRAIAGRRAAKALRASEERLRSLTEAATDAIIAADAGGRIVSWNSGAQAIFGYEAQEVLGRSLSIVIPERFRAAHDAGLARVVKHGEPAARVMGKTVEVAGLRSDGREFPLEMSLGTWVGEQGRFFIGVLRDISERRQAEQRLHLLLEEAPDAIIELDADGAVTVANAQIEMLLGRSRDGLLGRLATDFVIEADRRAVRHRFFAALSAIKDLDGPAGADQLQATVLRQDGTTVPVDMTFRPLQTPSGPAMTVILRDATERTRFEGELQHLADHDALTGLFNRRRFETELDRHVAHSERYGTGALLFLDLDAFKYVNDTYGHKAGDQLIQTVAGLLAGRLRHGDVTARLGGDEFAILLPHADVEQAQIVAADLLQAVRGAHISGHPHVRTTASIGVVASNGDEVESDQQLVQADLAMYEAKEAGGDRAIVFNPAAVGGLAARLRWTDRIRRALAEDSFVLHCQPIFDLQADRVTQHELLLRLPDDDGGLIPPIEFISIAERFGLIAAIDRWVTGQAIDLIASHESEGRTLRLEVNLSGKTIGDSELLELVRRRLVETQIDASCLVFEITETAAIADMQQAREFATSLRSLGCRFALDDFGSGFSSFSYLKHLPVDYIKIDGDFIRNLTQSSTDQLVVRSMVDIARGLGMQTIAEFVEDSATVTMLHGQGVDYAQGYYHGRPLPVAQALASAGRKPSVLSAPAA